MSEENLELVRTAMESFNLEGVDAVAERIHPDFATTTPPSLSVEPDTYRGPDGVRRWFDAWEGTMDEVRFDVDELIDAGDRGLARSRPRPPAASKSSRPWRWFGRFATDARCGWIPTPRGRRRCEPPGSS